MLQERMKQGNAHWKEEIEQQTEGKTNSNNYKQTKQTKKHHHKQQQTGRLWKKTGRGMLDDEEMMVVQGGSIPTKETKLDERIKGA